MLVMCVASAGYDMQGTVTKIASDVSRCVDRNSNIRIDTSTDNTPKTTPWRVSKAPLVMNVCFGRLLGQSGKLVSRGGRG